MKLVLEDGTEFFGTSSGVSGAFAGEVVFNTGMAGYIEAMTDPSYRGQILVFTHPLIGNYGVPKARRADSLDPPIESSRIQIQGLVVQNLVDTYSHHSATRSLAEWLESEHIPCITGIDTRKLTRKLREKGAMQGWLLPADVDTQAGIDQSTAISL